MRWLQVARAPPDIASLLAKPLRSCPTCLRQFGTRSRGPPGAGASAGQAACALGANGVAVSVSLLGGWVQGGGAVFATLQRAELRPGFASSAAFRG